MKELILKQAALFASLPPNETRYLAEALQETEVTAGTVFVHENEIAELFYILMEGQIEIIKALGTPNERVLAVGQPGAFIGEMGLINPGSRRSASVRARTNVRLLEMTRPEFDALLRRQPSLAYKMVRVLSLRLEETGNRNVRDLQEKNLQLTEAYEQLKAAQSQLIEKEKMERELEVACRIQQSMLPRKLPSLPGFDFGARIVPARAVGGDFYDFIPLGPNKLGIVVGDVSDKGVPAALFMALTSSLFRAEARRNLSLTDALRFVHRQILEFNDTGMFVTLVYGTLDCISREFHYARAGHELPLLFDARGDEISLPYKPALPLAAADDALLDEQRLVLPPGSLLLFYTDGITDQLNSEGTRFASERLRQAALDQRQAPAQAICDNLVELSTAFRSNTPQYDDITLVAVKSAAGPT